MRMRSLFTWLDRVMLGWVAFLVVVAVPLATVQAAPVGPGAASGAVARAGLDATAAEAHAGGAGALAPGWLDSLGSPGSPGSPSVSAPWQFAAPAHEGPRLTLGSAVEPLAAEANGLDREQPLGMSTFSRIGRAGRGQWPRTVYQAPPFAGDNFFVPGGIWRVENPKLFLMPFRAHFLQEGSGLVGGQFQQRLWGNGIFSGGLELWGLARPNDHGDFYRVEGDFGFLIWLGTQANVEAGLLVGIERDVLLVDRFDNRFGYEFGLTTRMTAWRFELRADWLMRIATDRLQVGTVRHSGRFSLMFEPLRLGLFGVEVGGWAHVITGGPPRVGLSAGIRLWFAVNRPEPDYVQRWGERTRN